MKILFITQWFQPEPMLKGMPFIKELRKRGHIVEVLTGFPNYPFGKLYPGYNLRLAYIEKIDGTRVIRTYLYPSHNRNAFLRIINYLSFAFFASLIGPFFIKKPDIIYVYHPPATTMFPAIICKYVFGAPIILDIQDMWPDTLMATGMIRSQKIINSIGFICKLFYKFADRIVVLSPGFKKLLISRGVHEDKIRIIYNWCDEDIIWTNNDSQKEYSENGLFKIVYAGNFGMAQSLEYVLKAANIVQKKEPRIKFIFIGTGTEEDKLKKLSVKLGLINVEFRPFVEPKKVGVYISEADALLVHLKKEKLFEITIPSKTQMYMAAGKPIIMCVSGDAAELVKIAKAGIVVEPESPEEIANAILKLYCEDKLLIKSYGESGRKYYESNLSIKAGTEKFENLFLELL